MPRTPLTIDQTLSLLAATPQRIAAATRGLSPAQLRARPSHDEWSANEVLAHLRACTDARGKPIITKILTEERPTLRAINPRSWIKETNYLDLAFRTSFRAFAKERAELLAVLEPLPRKSWSRAATITGAGAVIERTVLTYAQWLALHERPHVKQIEQIASATHGRAR